MEQKKLISIMDYEKPYEKREIDQLFHSLREATENEHKVIFDAIADVKDVAQKGLAQGLKTNGSVADLKMWRSFLTGATSVITLILVPILLAILQKWI